MNQWESASKFTIAHYCTWNEIGKEVYVVLHGLVLLHSLVFIYWRPRSQASYRIHQQLHPILCVGLFNEWLHMLLSKANSFTCALDLLPSRLLRDIISAILPTLAYSSNLFLFLFTGSIPSALKHAVIFHILKKTSLDFTFHSNCDPISLLPCAVFMFFPPFQTPVEHCLHISPSKWYLLRLPSNLHIA